MKWMPVIFLACLTTAAPGSVPPVVAGEMKASLDGIADPKILDGRFSRYGYLPTRTIAREPQVIRFRLPAVKDVGQTGIYSYFALAGDFEIAASFEALSITTPAKGYGASFGIALDTEGPDGNVSFARGQRVKEEPGFLVTRGILKDKEMHYESQRFPTKAKAGTFLVKRERSTLILSVAEGKGEPVELCKLPFSEATVRKVRLFADTGGSPTALDARIGNLKIRAEEITGGIPARDVGSGYLWWLIPLVMLAGGLGYYVYRRRNQDEE